MKTGTKGVIEITWGRRGGGGGKYECCLYIRLYKGNNRIRKSKEAMHRPWREPDTAEPARSVVIKTDLKANGFSWLRIVSDVRYTDSGKPLPVSRLGCYAAATASSSQSIGSLFTFAADPRRRLMARLEQTALTCLKETRSQNRLWILRVHLPIQHVKTPAIAFAASD
jgi:hypothetical protein